MRTRTNTILLCILATSAQAQTVHLRATTGSQLEASTFCGTKTHPANTDITSGLRLEQKCLGPLDSAKLSFTTWSQPVPAVSISSKTITDSSGQTCATSGTILLHLSAPRITDRVLDLRANHLAQRPGTSLFEVDIGNNGSVEWAWTIGGIGVLLPLRIPPAGITVAIRFGLASRASVLDTQTCILSARILEVAARKYGSSCGTNSLIGYPDPYVHGMAHLSATASTGAPCVFIFGQSRQNIPLPGRCSLLTDARVLLPFVPSPWLNSFQLSFPSASILPLLPIRAQFAQVTGSVIETSNGVEFFNR